LRFLNHLLSKTTLRTLALDIGNTAVKVGCFEGASLRRMQVLPQADGLLPLVRDWQPEHAIVSSVAEDALVRIDTIRHTVPGEVLGFSPATTAIPLHNAYATPHTLGADRLAAAVGAAHLRPGQHTLIVDAGTALKCDLVTADGTYWGGSIAPGLAMRLRALHEFTGRLPLVPLPEPHATVPLTGDSTTSSLLSGVVNGTVAEIAGTVAQYEQRHPGLGVLLTGGDAAFLAARLPARIFVIPELVLLGLNRILAYHVHK